MKPIYKSYINNCTSTLDASVDIEILIKQISKIVECKEYTSIYNSKIPIIVTIIANPDASILPQNTEMNNGLYIYISPELSSDKYVYSVQARLCSLSKPNIFQSCLITIGITDYQETLLAKSSSPIESKEKNTPAFVAITPKWSLDDVILTENIKKRIIRATSIIKCRDLIFDTWGYSKIDKATKSILCFYGPAGTGKTMTAQAIAQYLGKKIMMSSYAQIDSKWVGEGAKNLHAVFHAAEKQDAVLFFDEADSFLSNRISNTSSGSDKHYNRMSNEMFQLLEEFSGCVIFATNLVTDVDVAFKSRIVDSIKFELPDKDGIISLLKSMIPKEFPFEEQISIDQYSELAESINGFSGRDIRKSILLSLAGASMKYKKGEKEVFTFNDFKEGFDEVKGYKKQMEDEELNPDDLPLDSIQEIMDKQKFNAKLIEVAKLALLSDGNVNEKEVQLITELSEELGITIEQEIKVDKDLAEICEGVTSDQQKLQMIDIVSRMISIDEEVTDTEILFLTKLLNILGYKEDIYDSITNYVHELSKTNSTWNRIVEKDLLK